MRWVALFCLLSVPAMAQTADVHLHGHMDHGNVVLQMKDEATKPHRLLAETRLEPARAKAMVAWLIKNGFGPEPMVVTTQGVTTPSNVPPAVLKPEKEDSCGLGDFLRGKC